ncbi:unnamed protein product, partial [Heterotrigona itama]
VSFPFFHRAAGKQYFQVDRVNQQSFFFPITGVRLCFSPDWLTYFFTPPSSVSLDPTKCIRYDGVTVASPPARQ